MIGSIRGNLLKKAPPQLLIDVHGVGYELLTPMTTFYQLPAPGEEVQLVTHLAVREDAHVLYGFVDERTRELFRLLIKVNGVGPKLALAVLSGMDSRALYQCIDRGEVARLTKLPGIGRKTAERLVIELKDKMADLFKDQHTEVALIGASGTGGADGEADIHDEAVSALLALGYKNNEASRAVAGVKQSVDSSEELIRLALQNML